MKMNEVEDVVQLRYHELEPHAKEKAQHHYVEHWVGDDWFDYVYEDAKAEAKDYGFNIDEINFTGFWSQGDGACWRGDVHLLNFLDAHAVDTIGFSCWRFLIVEGWVGSKLDITFGGRYSHSNTMSTSLLYDTSVNYFDEDGEVDVLESDCILQGMPVKAVYDLIHADKDCPIKDYEDFEKWVLDEARQYADSIYKRLEQAYEDEINPDNVSEVYDANDVYFNEQGEIL
jgi:hypothetical protein